MPPEKPDTERFSEATQTPEQDQVLHGGQLLVHGNALTHERYSFAHALGFPRDVESRDASSAPVKGQQRG